VSDGSRASGALDLAKPDWWQIAEVTKRLGCVDVDGRSAFDWFGPAEIFREHAALSIAASSPDFDDDQDGHYGRRELHHGRRGRRAHAGWYQLWFLSTGTSSAA